MTKRRSMLKPGRTLRRIAAWTVLPCLAWLGFRLFEPVLVWSSGWKALPAASSGSGSTGGTDFAEADWGEFAGRAGLRLREAHSALGAPAISAAVAINGRRIWAGAVGLADVEAQREVTPQSRFRLGSTSKAVTSVGIGALLEAGRLDIDLPVRHYLPDLASPLATITTRQAMSHTAGVRDYGLCLCLPVWEHLNRRHFASTREALRVFERDKLLFDPGTRFAYSSYGYNVAGAVLEAAAATPFLDYLQRAVFDPLGMTRSGGDVKGAGVLDRASFYETSDGNYKPAFQVDNSIKWPSGGLLSTPTDMLMLGQAMLTDRVLSSATRERLLTPQRLADGSENPQGYALGFRVSDQKKLFDGTVTTRIISHHGTAVGSTSYFAILPEFGLVISVLMNKGQQNVEALTPHATALMELFLAELRRRNEGLPTTTEKVLLRPQPASTR